MRKYITFILIFLILIWGGISVTKQWLAERCYSTYVSSLWQNKLNSLPASKLTSYLKKATALDPSNPEYHFHLAEAYTQMMQETLKDGKWKLEDGKWIFDPGLRTLDIRR